MLRGESSLRCTSITSIVSPIWYITMKEIERKKESERERERESERAIERKTGRVKLEWWWTTATIFDNLDAVRERSWNANQITRSEGLESGKTPSFCLRKYSWERRLCDGVKGLSCCVSAVQSLLAAAPPRNYSLKMLLFIVPPNNEMGSPPLCLALHIHLLDSVYCSSSGLKRKYTDDR